MLHPGYSLLACVKEFSMTDLPEFVDVKYVDSLDFYNLSKKEIPEEILSIPVITVDEEDKKVIYVNFNALHENEYYVTELMVFQLIKILENNESAEFKAKCKNSIIQKHISEGAELFLEYKQLSLLMSIMYKLYNTKEYTYEKKNPYTFKQNKKIALKIISNAIQDSNPTRISRIIYGMSRLKGNYNYKNIIQNKDIANYLNKLNSLLQENEFDTISKKTLNEIGLISKKI